MDLTSSSLQTVDRQSRGSARCVVIVAAILLTSMVLAVEYLLGHLWQEESATEPWQRLAEIVVLAVLLSGSFAATVACYKNQKAWDVERRLRAEIEFQSINSLATHDPLTALPNKRAVVSVLEESIVRAEGTEFAFYLLDINGFTSVNVAYGAATGDAILRVVAQRFRSVERSCDLIARFECDSFAVLAGDVRSRHEAMDVAGRYVTALDHSICIDDRAHMVGVTAGIAYYPEDGATAAELIRCAEHALQAEKAIWQSDQRFFVAMINVPAV